MFISLSSSRIYSHKGKLVVFCEFDPVRVMVRIRDMAGEFYWINLWELEERKEE